MVCIKLSRFKRLLMFGLIFMVNIVFQTHVSYAILSTTGADVSNDQTCKAYCSANGYYIGYIGNMATFVNNAYVNGVAPIGTYCYCLYAQEYSMLSIAANITQCSSINGMTGPGKGLVAYFVTGSTMGTYYADSSCYCAKGHYNSDTLRTQCTSCAPGRYAPATGAITCVACSSGYYAAGYGATGCSICPKNTYQPSSGSSSCLGCPSPAMYASMIAAGGYYGYLALSAWNNNFPFPVGTTVNVSGVPLAVNGMTSLTGQTSMAACYFSPTTFYLLTDTGRMKISSCVGN